MADSKITVSVSCPCGGELETLDHVRTANSIVTCKICKKEFGTWHHVKRQMDKTAKGAADKLFKSITDDFNKSIQRINRLNK